jgi:hypothetical protein
MKNNLMKAMKLARYGLGARMNLCMLILFGIGGVVWEFWAAYVQFEILGFFDYGGVLLACGAMIVGQLLVSVDIAEMVQTSPYKKKIQISMPVQIGLVGNMVVLTLMIAIRILGCVLAGHEIGENLSDLWMPAVFIMVIMMWTGVLYKHFIASVIAFYLALAAMGVPSGIYERLLRFGVITWTMHPAVSVLLSYGLIVLGALGQYGISHLFWRHELSKIAFGAAATRNLKG